MKKINKIISIIPLTLSLMSFNSKTETSLYEKEILILVNENSNLTYKQNLIDYLKLNNVNYYSLDNLSESDYSKYYCFNFSSKNDFSESFQKLKKLENIIYVEENKVIFKDEFNEEDITSENNIQLSSLNSYKAHYELIKSEEAKKLPGENKKVNVAIIDAPVNFDSSILKSKFDTTYSKEFNQNEDKLVALQRKYHGCAVSYIIGGTSNTSKYSSGICENVNIIALTIPSVAEISDFVAIMNYLNNLPIDVPITNCSYSMGGDTSKIMEQTIKDYKGLFICAAANGYKKVGYDLDDPKNKTFPAQYSFDNMIIVGESTTREIKSDESNYGKTTVDIFAPAYNIYSIDQYDNFNYFYGTSFAAPLVTGACALMLSKDSSLTSTQIKSRIMDYADKVDTLKDYCIDGNRLNVFSSIHTANHTNIYTWQNTKKHLSTCTICDKQTLEGHIVSGGTITGGQRYSTCLLCKGDAEFGFITKTCSLNSVDKYEYINGLFYPKETQIVDGILDLSYEDSLKYEKK